MSDDIVSVLYRFRIQDFFDIVIISTLIYGLLIWFKKTTSRLVLVGIGVLGAIYLLSRFFQLYLTALALQAFFAALVIMLVVIFQEELRRFFERLAMWGDISKGSSPSSSSRDLDIIVQACGNLTRNRIGALLVIPGDEPLDRHLEGGVKLDGLLSEALLQSIFDPHSEGHDGAVVIHRGRVTQFGSRLPLSSRSDRLRHVGLRHAAALGLAERSDALCIVVSEERGVISVARHGNLVPLIGTDRLTETLKTFTERKTSAGRSDLFSRLRKNSAEKSTALVLAVVLWLVFGYQKELISRDFLVPIQYKNLSADWVIEQPKVTEAKVMLTAPEQAFRLLDPNTLKISLDLANIREGKQNIRFTSDMMDAPENLSLERISPDGVEIIGHRIVPVKLPVAAVTLGAVPEGYQLGKIEVTPPSVTVLAPAGFRKKQENLTIRTEPIQLNQIVQTTTVVPRLVVPPDLRFPDGKSPDVKITIEVTPRHAGKPREAR